MFEKQLLRKIGRDASIKEEFDLVHVILNDTESIHAEANHLL